jgi:tetratricopeptide (TPR) repeat protein
MLVVVALALAVVPASRPTLFAQAIEPFSATEEITAVDLVVQFVDSRLGGLVVSTAPPRQLSPTDFRLTLDGAPRTIVGVGEGTAGAGEVDRWTLVLYFDLPLAGASSVRWAARQLAILLPELTELGAVTIVVADPEPEVRTRATRDTERLAEVLFDLEGTPAASPALESVRSEFLEELHAAEPRFATAELLAAAVAEEQSIVSRQLDALALSLVEHDAAGGRRAVVFVSDGFDVDPGRFYAEWVEGEDLARISLAPGSTRTDLVESTSRTLAGYGWIALPLVGPGLDTGLVRGLRIGKWRLAGPATPPYLGVRLERESNRDRDQADAYLELGKSLLDQGRAEDAEQALRRALFHYSGDPRTAGEQAAASVALGGALEAQGRDAEALEARAVAVALDPALAERYPVAEAVSEDSPWALERLAQATAGSVARDPEELAAAIAGLADRVRLTYQTAGPPDGSLRQVEVRHPASGLALRAPRWNRSGTPATVAAARVRTLLQGELVEGELGVDVLLEAAGPGGSQARLLALLEPPPPAEPGTTSSFRLTIGSGLPDRPASIRHEMVDWPTAAGEMPGWAVAAPAEATAGAEVWIAVLVEDLTTGRWGCGLLAVAP